MKHFEIDTDGTLTTGLDSYFKLEDATDYYGTLGTLTNNGTVTFSAGKVYNGGNFNGTSQYLQSSTLPSTKTSSFSVAGWVKVNSTSEHGIFLSNGKNASAGWAVGVGSGSVASAGNNLCAVSFGGSNIDFGAAIGSGWHHIVLTVDSSQVWRGYIDGVLCPNTATQTPGTPSGHFTLGADDDGSGVPDSWAYFPGMLDEWGIWDKVLSPQEITNLYNGGSGQTMVANTTYTASASLSMMNAASRYATATYQHFINWVRSASVSMMNAASRYATATYHQAIAWARTASVSMMNSASRYASAVWAESVTWIRTASVSMMNSASRYTKATKAFIIKISNTIRWDFWTWD